MNIPPAVPYFLYDTIVTGKERVFPRTFAPTGPFLVHITGIDFHGKASSLFRCLDYTISGTSAGCPTGKIGRK
jgi:hypothetical protein